MSGHDLATLLESFALDDLAVDSVDAFLHGHSLSGEKPFLIYIFFFFSKSSHIYLFFVQMTIQQLGRNTRRNVCQTTCLARSCTHCLCQTHQKHCVKHFTTTTLAHWPQFSHLSHIRRDLVRFFFLKKKTKRFFFFFFFVTALFRTLDAGECGVDGVDWLEFTNTCVFSFNIIARGTRIAAPMARTPLSAIVAR
jgi:hypothetical protein